MCIVIIATETRNFAETAAFTELHKCDDDDDNDDDDDDDDDGGGGDFQWLMCAELSAEGSGTKPREQPDHLSDGARRVVGLFGARRW